MHPDAKFQRRASPYSPALRRQETIGNMTGATGLAQDGAEQRTGGEAQKAGGQAQGYTEYVFSRRLPAATD